MTISPIRSAHAWRPVLAPTGGYGYRRPAFGRSPHPPPPVHRPMPAAAFALEGHEPPALSLCFTRYTCAGVDHYQSAFAAVRRLQQFDAVRIVVAGRTASPGRPLVLR